MRVFIVVIAMLLASGSIAIERPRSYSGTAYPVSRSNVLTLFTFSPTLKAAATPANATTQPALTSRGYDGSREGNELRPDLVVCMVWM